MTKIIFSSLGSGQSHLALCLLIYSFASPREAASTFQEVAAQGPSELLICLHFQPHFSEEYL